MRFVILWPVRKWAVIGIAVTSCNLIDCCLLKCQTSSNPTVSLKMLTFASFKYWQCDCVEGAVCSWQRSNRIEGIFDLLGFNWRRRYLSAIISMVGNYSLSQSHFKVMNTIKIHQREINPGKMFFQGENKQSVLRHLLWEWNCCYSHWQTNRNIFCQGSNSVSSLRGITKRKRSRKAFIPKFPDNLDLQFAAIMFCSLLVSLESEDHLSLLLQVSSVVDWFLLHCQMLPP